MEDFTHIIGKNVRLYRLKKGLTQVQLSDLCYPMDRCTISRIERFVPINITIGTLGKIAEALEVDIKVLLTEKPTI